MSRFLISLSGVFISLLFFINSSSGQTFDYLESTTATGSGITTDNSQAWTDLFSISIDLGSNVNDTKYVLVTASINMRPDGIGFNTQAREGNYNIYRSGDTSDKSGIIKRQMKANSETDVMSWGIGTLVHIFDVSSLSGSITYTLEHSNQGGSAEDRNVYSSARLTAVALSSKNGHYELSNDVIRLDDPGATTTSATYAAVTNLTTAAITLPVNGDIYVAASINGKANGATVAEYKLQYSDDNGTSWFDLGKPVKRSMVNQWDDGIVSLVGLLQDQASGSNYKFRVAHRNVNATNTVTTHYCNLVAVALAHNGGGYFPSFYSEVGSSGVSIAGVGTTATTVTSSSFTAVADIGVKKPGLFVNSQYLVSASNLDVIGNPDERMRAGNQIKADDGTTIFSAEQYFRYISDNSNFGAGGFIGLMENLNEGDTYTIKMEHEVVAVSSQASPDDETLTTSEVILMGFQTFDQPSISWDGVTTDWLTASNWSTGVVPGSDDGILIPAGLSSFPIIPNGTSVSCKNMFIEPGANLDIVSGGTLSVAAGGVLTIDSDASNSGSLIVDGTLTGAVNYKRYLSGIDNWHMISSPLTGQVIETVLTDVSNDIAFKSGVYALSDYNEATNLWNSFFASTGNGNFTDGKGYQVLRNTDGIINFGGSVLTATLSKSVTLDGFGWNCIGNPYPSAIDINVGATNFLDVNGGVINNSYEAIYCWDGDAATPSYFAINATTDYRIPPGQAFFIRVNTATNVSISTPMRTHTSSSFKSLKSSWPGITLIAKNKDFDSKTRIQFGDGMTNGLDVSYDAGMFKSNSKLSLFTKLVEDNGIDFTIQCLPPNYNELIIPVGIDAVAGDQVIFTAETTGLPENASCYFEDRQAGTFVRLDLPESSYTVDLTTENLKDGSFYIHTSLNTLSNIDDVLNQDDIMIVINQPEGYIGLIGQIKDNSILKVYDLAGRLRIEKPLGNSSNYTINISDLNRGIYILKIENDGKPKIKKFSW